MAVETATYVSDLEATYPGGNEPVAQGDNHLRLIKSVLQNTFPSADHAILPLEKTGDTGAAHMPAGTTAQRPATPQYGDQRTNSELNSPEWWNGTAWVSMGSGQMYGIAQEKAIFYNSQTIGENLTVKAGQNGGSFGPVTVNNGFAVTVEPGSVWSVV